MARIGCVRQLLYRASRTNNMQLVRTCIQSSFTGNIYGKPLIHGTHCKSFEAACNWGNIGIAKYLHAHKDLDVRIYVHADGFNTNFTDACGGGHLELAQWILSKDASIKCFAKGGVAFRQALLNGHIDVVQWLMHQDPTATLNVIDGLCDEFICACTNGYLDVAKWILRNNPGIDISANNYSCYRNALSNGHVDVVRWMRSCRDVSV